MSEISGKFRNVKLEKDEQNQLDRSCEKLRSITKSQRKKEYPLYKKNKEC